MKFIRLIIPGQPVAKGSWIAKHGVFIPDNRANLQEWTKQIKKYAQYQAPEQPSSKAIDVKIDFFMPASSTDENPCITRPDLDKLARAVIDALSGVIYIDDRQIIRLELTKQFTIYDPGCHIEIRGARDCNGIL